MGYDEHPLFRAPDPVDSVIWRYLDFTKFVSMLNDRTLHFARADLLGDRFEGSFPQQQVGLRGLVWARRVDPAQAKWITEQQSQFARALTKYTYVNCWNVGEHESAALWSMYARPDAGLAIRSTFKRLTDSLRPYKDHQVHVGLVNYIDYRTDYLPEGNTLYPFLHKRRSFDFEREVRAVIQDLTPWPDRGDDPGEGAPSIKVLVSPMDLIERVHVAPTAPAWFRELVESVTRRYEYGLEVRQSDLAGDPVY